MVGPIGVKKPRPLPSDLQEVVNDTGGHGFIIVSFGSYVEKIINKEKIDILATAFTKLKQKVLWKHKGKLRFNLLVDVSYCAAFAKLFFIASQLQLDFRGAEQTSQQMSREGTEKGTDLFARSSLSSLAWFIVLKATACSLH